VLYNLIHNISAGEYDTLLFSPLIEFPVQLLPEVRTNFLEKIKHLSPI